MLENILKNAGLNERESKVYLAVLELGQSTVLPISKKSGIKRTYCYDILDDLQKKGLVSYFEQNNRRRYSAEDPKKIEALLEDRLSAVSEAMPELRGLYNGSAEKPKVRYYEGKEGVIQIYNELLNSKSFDAITSTQLLYQNMGKYLDSYNKKNKNKKPKIRELITSEGVGAEYIMEYMAPDQEARQLPESVKLSTDTIIFDNKLAIVSYSENIHAVVIESQNIVDTQKALFETLWAQAEPVNNK